MKGIMLRLNADNNKFVPVSLKKKGMEMADSSKTPHLTGFKKDREFHSKLKFKALGVSAEVELDIHLLWTRPNLSDRRKEKYDG